MQYRTLGRTEIQVSPYALGTLMFATVMGNAPENWTPAWSNGKTLDAGVLDLIDTADTYGDSGGRGVVGKALQGRRDGWCSPPSSAAESAEPRQPGHSRRGGW